MFANTTIHHLEIDSEISCMFRNAFTRWKYRRLPSGRDPKLHIRSLALQSVFFRAALFGVPC